MIKKKYLRSLLPVALVACAFAQPSVAVLDFAANGLPAYEVETLVERFRAELPNTGAVIEIFGNYHHYDYQILSEISGVEYFGFLNDIKDKLPTDNRCKLAAKQIQHQYRFI